MSTIVHVVPASTTPARHLEENTALVRRIPILLLLLSAFTLYADDPAPGITITSEALGDTDSGVVVRLKFHFAIPGDIPNGVPLVIVGSTSQGGQVVKRFRYPLAQTQREQLTAIQTLSAGDADIDARLMVPLEEQAPVIVAKVQTKIAVAKTNRPYAASITDGAEAILAEGMVPEVNDAVRIAPPRRDVAPNLFIVTVDVKPPVKRVEFWVEGKKVLARNSPPYRAELDLGNLPKRVEIRAVGYDANGRYVDADAFTVNERETPLEVKITRTSTPDRVAHLKLSIQNPRGTPIKTVVLYAGQKKIYEWSGPPYALDVPEERLKDVAFLRASVTDATNYEASDLLFLNGTVMNEVLEVNLIELPVTVSDAAGNAILGLKKENFKVRENSKLKTITNFDAASNLPISVGLLIDHSGSMKQRMEATRKAASEFLSRIITPRDKAFVAGFSFDATKEAPFVSASGSLAQQLAAVPDAEGGTSLHDAIVTALYRFRGVQGRKALVVLTDGDDTTSRVPYDEMLTYARAARVPLYFIGVGMNITDISGTSKMKSLAAESGGVAYFVNNVKKLGETYAQLESELRSQYVIAYETESSKNDRAYRAVNVEVDRPDARVRSIRGFLP
jgi:VWFA-related protein